MTARIEAVCISGQKGQRKEETTEALFTEGEGIRGDAHAGPWHRQVSLLGLEDVADFRSRAGIPLSAGIFAENLLVSGLDLGTLGLGSRIRIGDGVALSVTQLGKTCHDRCAIYRLAGDCIMPRRGVFARVTAGGAVRKGDAVRVEHLISRAIVQAVVITVSDRCSRGETKDTAGPAIVDALTTPGWCHVYRCEVVPDERELLVERLRHYSDGHSIDLVVAVGGTGFAPRDVTPEAVRDVVERLTPGLDEAMRSASSAHTPMAMLSRAASGIRGGTLILSLPGSRKAALENIEAILPALEHGMSKLRGDPSDCGRPQVK